MPCTLFSRFSALSSQLRVFLKRGFLRIGTETENDSVWLSILLCAHFWFVALSPQFGVPCDGDSVRVTEQMSDVVSDLTVVILVPSSRLP